MAYIYIFKVRHNNTDRYRLIDSYRHRKKHRHTYLKNIH